MLQWHERVMLQWKLEKGVWNDAQIFNFFESPSKRRLRVCIALALFLVGLSLFVWQIDDVAALEQSRREPVQVEAVIHVEVVDGTYNDEYISYVCDGVSYDRVYLGRKKSWLSMEREGKTMVVTLDPRDHGKLERDMVKDNWFLCSVLMMALGASGLLYSAVLGADRVRRWLVCIAGTENRKQDVPDYLLDFVMLTLVVYLVLDLVLWRRFPQAVGFGPALTPILLLVFGVILRQTIRLYERKN